MPDVLVLCYHGVSESWPAETAVTPQRLGEQLSALLRRGWSPATFTGALTAPRERRTLAVTFDDAPRSVLTHAAPVLDRLGVPATVFVPTDFPDSGRPMGWPGQEQWVGGEHERELECLSWEELGRLAGAGWEIGSHTRSHPRLTTLDDAALADELRGSRAECERRLGGPCRSLAYPYGDVDARVVAAARDAGYLAAATTPRWPVAPLPLQWPRVGVYRGDTARRLQARIWRRRSGQSGALARAVDRGLRAGRAALSR